MTCLVIQLDVQYLTVDAVEMCAQTNGYIAIESLSDAQRQQLTYEHSDSKFRFGDNRVWTPMTKATIPANIGNKEVTVETDAGFENCIFLASPVGNFDKNSFNIRR